jgi:hypothetical protein
MSGIQVATCLLPGRKCFAPEAATAEIMLFWQFCVYRIMRQFSVLRVPLCG